MVEDKKVLAVILNYNSYEDSMKCAMLLKQQTYKNLTVAIIDNKSTDNSEEMLITVCKEQDVLFVQSGTNKGFSTGNNVGLRKATELGCKYGLVINPDVEIKDKDYVAKAVAKMDRDKNIAVLGSDVINMQQKHQNPMRELNLFENTFWFVMLVISKLVKKDIYVGDYKKSGYVHKVSGCCFFVDMEYMEKDNYLDDNVFLYCEEPILAARVKRAGKKEYYYSDIKAYHMHKASEKGNVAKNLERFYDSRIYYIEKYRYSGIIKKIVTASIKLQKKVMVKKNSK